MKKVLTLIIFLLFCGTLFGNYIWDHDKFSENNTWDIGEDAVRGRNLYFVLVDANTLTDGVLSINSGSITDMGNITGSDVDISAGTGNYLSSGTFISGGITIFDVTPVLVFKDSNNTGAASIGFIEWRDSANTRLGFLGNSTNQNDDLLWKNEFSGGHIKIETTGAGEFQIFADTVLNNNSITGINNLSALGTVQGGQITSTGNIIIADNGFIGSVGEPSAIQIDEFGNISLTDNFVAAGIVHSGGLLRAVNTSGDSQLQLIGNGNTGNLIFEGVNDVFVFDKDIVIGDGSVDTVGLNFRTSEDDFRIEWESENAMDELRFDGSGVAGGIWDILLETSSANMNIIVDGSTSTLTMQNFDVIIEEDLELGGDLTVDTDTLLVDSTLHSVGIGAAPIALAKLLIQNTFTDFTGTPAGIKSLITVAPSQASIAVYSGIEGAIVGTDAEFDISGGLKGVSGNVDYVQTGAESNDIDVSEVTGIFSKYTVIINKGKVSDVYGIDILPTVVAFGAGVIDRHTGLNIPDITGATDNFAIVTKAGKVSFGDETTIGDDTNQTVISATGLQTFHGTAGLPYGSLYLHEGSQTVGINAVGQGVYVKVTGLTTGLTNNVTINSDAFNVDTIGVYRIFWQISGDSAGINKDYEVDIFINEVEQPDGSARREFGAQGALGSFSGTCLCDITDTAHDIDIRVKEVGTGAGTDFDIFNMNFNIAMVGGT